MSDIQEQRLRELEKWLGKNVVSLSDPTYLTLFDFDVDWTRWKGSFCVKLDNAALKDRFRWQMDITGFPSFSAPIFTSPLGVPASFAALEMSDALGAAILQGLKQTFPKLNPLGRNRDTGIEITYHTAVEYRLSADQIRETKARVTAGYAVTVSVGG